MITNPNPNMRISSMAGLLAMVAALILGGTSADAHPRIITADPAVRGTVAASPGRISITFSEPLFLRLCSVALRDSAGHTLRTGPSVLAPSDSRQLITPILAPLPPGVYSVTWHAVAADTHRVQGVYTFTLQ